MNATVFSALAISALTLSGAPAFADWQYTQWGMTPDEVLTASEGAAQRPDMAEGFGTNLVHLLTAPYALTDGQLQFKARFVFYDFQSLEMVSLVPFVGECVSVYRRLEETYGPGGQHGDQIIRLTKWFDRENDNVIFFTEIQDTCTLSYRRFHTPMEAGGL
ncbi:MAG: hypothetical protein ACRBCL_12130 [Maritimibacter sp.]